MTYVKLNSPVGTFDYRRAARRSFTDAAFHLSPKSFADEPTFTFISTPVSSNRSVGTVCKWRHDDRQFLVGMGGSLTDKPRWHTAAPADNLWCERTTYLAKLFPALEPLEVLDVLVWTGSSAENLSAGEAETQATALLDEDILSDLRGLTDGWSGNGSSAPSANVLNDVADLLDALKFNEAGLVPDVAVDEDGSVTLTFELAGDRVLAFEVSGKGRVLAAFVHSEPEKSQAKLVRPISRREITKFLESVDVSEFA